MTKKPHKYGKILGVRVSSTQKRKVLKNVASDIRKGRHVLIVTPNPEIVLKAQEDNTLISILNKADYCIPDGIGLVAWNKFLSLPNPKDKFKRLLTLFVQGLGVEFSILFNRQWLFAKMKPIKGRELAFELINLAWEKSLKVFLLGGETGEAAKAKKVLKERFPGLLIDSFQGPLLDTCAHPLTRADEVLGKDAVSRIDEFSPDILLVGMTPPRQEKWLYRWLPKINAKVGMTVGGTFKYFSGERSMPPSFVNDMGLEWLWRLFTGSQNIERVGKALWEFPWRVFWYKFNL